MTKQAEEKVAPGIFFEKFEPILPKEGDPGTLMGKGNDRMPDSTQACTCVRVHTHIFPPSSHIYR